ncbi:hypothetical protein [Kribbella solani]|uniref:Uncharacterized protein n=1 Tax=Kribbella solani TaxID=236067 RepID=A0A841DZI9_9ACTN|nr:hypothetical protein [Kribbella solani]MBB5983973.1 hypothetical protein [Kribbella solani]
MSSHSDHLVLDRAAVDRALRSVIEYADYDLHKALEGDETGEDTYAEHVARFIAAYGAAHPAERGRGKR